MRPQILCVVVLVCACSGNSGEAGAGASGVAGVSAGGSGTGTGGGNGSGGTGSGGRSTGGSGAVNNSGGAATGGGSGSGGATPTGGSGGMLGTGGSVASSCKNPITTLPAGAPQLTPGTWLNISPAGVPFDAAATAFGQGITLDPCNVGTLYLSVVGFDPTTAKAGVYKSTNAGASWTKVGPLDEPINVVVDPRDSRHLYASDGVRGSTMGFWVSTDAGATWTIPAGFTNTAKSVGGCCDVYHVDPDPANFDHLLVSFHSPWSSAGGTAAGVLESTDGGTTWTAHAPVSGFNGGYGYGIFFLSNPALGMGDSKTWLLGCQYGKGHWRTTDAGGTWTQVTSNSLEHGGNQIYYTKTGVLYAGGYPNAMRSTDNGATWKMLSPNQNPAGYLSIIGDGTHLYTALHNGPTSVVTASEVDGASWTTYNSQQFNEGPFEMAFDATNGILYASMIRSGAWALKVK